MGTGFGMLLEFFSSRDGEVIVDECTEWVLFLDAKVWVEPPTGFDIELPFTSREPGKVPIELDLSIDELLTSVNGFGPPDTECEGRSERRSRYPMHETVDSRSTCPGVRSENPSVVHPCCRSGISLVSY